jgi:hypothetical protein
MAKRGAAKAKGTNGTHEPAAETVQTLPLFYRGPRPVDASRHAKYGVVGQADLSFARTTNVIPLNIGEMATASKCYPIVFAAEPPHMPVVICGVQDGVNVFVTAGNRWAQNAYVPAYVRRYPFIFMESQDREQLILSIDESSDLVSEGGDQPLFDADGKQTEIVNRALEFCKAFHQQNRATREFVAALAEHELLTDNTTEIRLSENRRIELTGYKIIDARKLDELDDKVFLEFRKHGWLPAIYHQQQSGSNWPNILWNAAARNAEQAADAAGEKPEQKDS